MLVVVLELLLVFWVKLLVVLVEEFFLLEVEVLFLLQVDVMCMFYDNMVQLVLVFECYVGNDCEVFQEFSSEMMVVVIVFEYLVWLCKKCKLCYEDLYDICQIVVVSCDVSILDLCFFFVCYFWCIDNYLVMLLLVCEGLGWVYLLYSLVQVQIEVGMLVVIDFDNISNQQCMWVDVVWNKD